MTTSTNNSIRTWIPVSLSKGKDGNGKETTKMKIGGLASTARQDDDGEILDPNGFELDYFLESGYLNWNHQAIKDPSAIIGKPTVAEKTEKGLVIEGELFNSEKAKQVYALAETLSEHGLQLGFSIEGKALERGSLDPTDPEFRNVKRALITGMAITPNPKNHDSVMEIVKGNNYNQLSAYSDEDQDTIDKALSVASESGQALAKESLDGTTHVHNHKEKEETVLLTKAQAYATLVQRFPSFSGQTYDRIYSQIISTMENKNNDTTAVVSEDQMSKALDQLEALSKGNIDDLLKGHDDEKEEENNNLKKGKKPTMKPKGEEDDEEEEDDDDLEKAITPEHIEAATLILKGVGYTVLSEQEKNDLMKGHSSAAEKTDADLRTLNAVVALNKKLEIQATSSATLIKGLMESNETLKSQVGNILSHNPGIKAVTTAAAIPHAGDLSKGHGENNKDTPQVLSLRMHKNKIMDLIETKVWNEDQTQILNKGLATDLQIFESSGQMSQQMVQILNKEGFNLVQ
jgi:hypothetical protein